MDMPSELSKYIQDFIRPHKPVTENIKEIYEYFVELEQRMGEQFRYKVGMTLKIKDKQYNVIKTDKFQTTLQSEKGVSKKYRNFSLNMRCIDNKSIFIKRYIRTANMVILIWKYLYRECPFNRMIILKKYKKFWTSYI